MSLQPFSNFTASDTADLIRSFFYSSDALRARRVCRAWNEWIQKDPRWEKLAAVLQNRVPLAKELMGFNYSLSVIGEFCTKAQIHFDKLFPQGIPEILDDMPLALKTIDSTSADLLKKFKEALNDDSFDLANELCAKIRLTGNVPASTPISAKLHIVFDSFPEKAQLVLDMLEGQITMKDLNLAILSVQGKKHVSRMIDAIIKSGNKEEISKFDEKSLVYIIKSCPEHLTKYLEAMNIAGCAPGFTDILTAAGTKNSQEYFLPLMKAMLEGKERFEHHKLMMIYSYVANECPHLLGSVLGLIQSYLEKNQKSQGKSFKNHTI